MFIKIYRTYCGCCVKWSRVSNVANKFYKAGYLLWFVFLPNFLPLHPKNVNVTYERPLEKWLGMSNIKELTVNVCKVVKGVKCCK